MMILTEMLLHKLPYGAGVNGYARTSERDA